MQWIYSKEMFLLENLVGTFADGGEIAVTSCHLIPRCPTLVSVSSFSINITFNLNLSSNPTDEFTIMNNCIWNQFIINWDKTQDIPSDHTRYLILIDFLEDKIFYDFPYCKSTQKYGNYYGWLVPASGHPESGTCPHPQWPPITCVESSIPILHIGTKHVPSLLPCRKSYICRIKSSLKQEYQY